MVVHTILFEFHFFCEEVAKGHDIGSLDLTNVHGRIALCPKIYDKVNAFNPGITSQDIDEHFRTGCPPHTICSVKVSGVESVETTISNHGYPSLSGLLNCSRPVC